MIDPDQVTSTLAISACRFVDENVTNERKKKKLDTNDPVLTNGRTDYIKNELASDSPYYGRFYQNTTNWP